MPRRAAENDRLAAFRVPAVRHVCTQLVVRHPRFWKACGGLESRVLAEKLHQIEIRQPVYIAGLARSGSTMLLELVAAHGQVATHRYCDFPFVFTPYWWGFFLQRARRQPAPPAERAHADGLLVTPESPEALEEMLWMAFFPQSHQPACPLVLGPETRQPAFARFYRDHLRKLLAARGRSRYAAKGNYHVARLEYLHALFPDARFVIPIRGPRAHVASLHKQQRLFVAGETRHPRALAQMRASGHFEFGLDRRPMNLGRPQAWQAVRTHWQEGREVRGWACYWSYVYGYLAGLLAANEGLRRVTLVVRYEDLCREPAETIRRLWRHCRLPLDEPLIEQLQDRVRAPAYYQPDFTPAEEEAIREETAATAERWGYPAGTGGG